MHFFTIVFETFYKLCFNTQHIGYINNRKRDREKERKRAEMLQGIQELKVAVNKQGYYIIIVNGEVVSEMIAKHELAEAIEAVLKDEYGMVADMLNRD